MRLRLCTLGRTEIRLHSATLLLAAYMILCGRWGMFAAGMASILLHEGAHAAAACLMGAPPETLELTPLGCVLHMEEDSRLTPWRRLAVLAAGPAMTLLLCHGSLRGAAGGWLPIEAAGLCFTANAGILLVNLLPCLPLDGGRLLALMLDYCMGSRRSAAVMRWLGVLTGIICVALSLIVTWRTGCMQFTLAACGCVMLYAARRGTVTAAMAELHAWMTRKIRIERLGLMSVRVLSVMADTPLRRLIARLPHRARAEVTVLEPGSMRVLARRTEEDIIAAYMDAPASTCRALLEGP